MLQKINIFWFRRDLRLKDNIGFTKALQSKYPVLPLFIFDSKLLDKLPKDDARVTFIYTTLQNLRQQLQKRHDSSLAILYGTPHKVFKNLLKQYNVHSVYTNKDFEPYGLLRDNIIQSFLLEQNIKFKTYLDHVLFDMQDITKKDGNPYLVFTPFKSKWKQALQNYAWEIKKENLTNLIKVQDLPNVTLKDIGFIRSSITVPKANVNQSIIANYSKTRDFPALEGTSNLSVYLRFGTIEYRALLQHVLSINNEQFLNELIWREFFIQILYHFPNTITQSFKPKYNSIKWINNTDDFETWKTGTTGYPIVDAGMRQLNNTGLMHNRVRMIAASFLCKHLLIDWRWGEAYFAQKLLDFEQASNTGNWQWVAGCGVDAAPYFRIFNPITQAEKFDASKHYIKTWVKDYGTSSYPKKMIDHKYARERCLKVFKDALNQSL